MLRLIIISLLLNITIVALSQKKSDLKKQHERMIDTLKKKITGVKYVDFGFTNAQETMILNNVSSLDAQVLIGFVNYVKMDLGLKAIVTAEQRKELSKLATSACDIVRFNYDFGEFNSKLIAIGNYPLTFSFTFCDRSTYSFKTKMHVDGLTIYHKRARETCAFEFINKNKYDITQRINLQKSIPIITQNQFIKYFDSSSHKNPFEGVYQLFSSVNNTSKYKLAIFNSNDTLKVIYFEGANFKDDWQDGELKGYLMNTNSANDFFAKWISLDKTQIDASITFIDKNAFILKSSDIYNPIQEDKYIRIR